jgi:hypothetical protein
LDRKRRIRRCTQSTGMTTSCTRSFEDT